MASVLAEDAIDLHDSLCGLVAVCIKIPVLVPNDNPFDVFGFLSRPPKPMEVAWRLALWLPLSISTVLAGAWVIRRVFRRPK